MTYQIIYSSEAATPMQSDDLEDLLEQARESNAASGITGALVYVEGVFLQILEGERGSIEKLMAKIAADVRHETVTVLRAGAVPCASFSDWNMAYVSATPGQIAKWAGLAGVSEVNGTPTGEGSRDAERAAEVTRSILSQLPPRQGGTASRG